jgi:transcriptional regulator with XRE-family HTH domain
VEGDLQQRLGRNLRILRKGKGLSQEAFADALEIHRTYMGGLERGERNVTLKTVERIAAALGIDPADLLSDQLRTAEPDRPSQRAETRRLSGPTDE